MSVLVAFALAVLAGCCFVLVVAMAVHAVVLAWGERR